MIIGKINKKGKKFNTNVLNNSTCNCGSCNCNCGAQYIEKNNVDKIIYDLNSYIIKQLYFL